MSSAQKIKFNILNPLLTETLPFELPFLINNFHFVDRFKAFTESSLWHLIEKNIDKSKSGTIPFEFKIVNRDDSYRTLSLVHPYSQIRLVDIYNKSKFSILELCKKSPASLRYPDRIASVYYEKLDSIEADDNFDRAVETSSLNSNKVASSFFSYKKYNFIYKFYESYDFHRYERKYRNLLKLDISKCFHNIYTHSISWAVRDKRFAKTHRGHTFESDFDIQMQRSNYNETNGIVVGPELSRLFAEIILQKIDLNIISDLKNKNLHYGREYTFKRYIDDYFIFYDKAEHSDEIKETVSRSLEQYKLYLNDKKSHVMVRPFSTPETIIKSELKILIDSYYSRLLNQDSLNSTDKSDIAVIKKSWGVNKISNGYIRDFKAIVKKNNGSYDSIVNYSISASKRRLKSILAAIKNGKAIENDSDLSSFLRIVMEFNFFIYSMSPKVTSTYLIGEIILMILKIIEGKDISIKDNIKKHISDEIIMVLEYSSMKHCKYPSVEALNLLMILKSLGKKFMLRDETLKKLFSIDSEEAWNPNYFHICVLLNFIENDDQYLTIKNFISQYLITHFNADTDLTKSENVFLLFDTLACPFINDDTKDRVLSAVYSVHKESQWKQSTITSKMSTDRNIFAESPCFFNWRQKLTLSDLYMALRKKQLRTAY